jgi:hypothetical protein
MLRCRLFSFPHDRRSGVRVAARGEHPASRRRRYSPMDKLTIKTPNPKCRLYWCLIEFIDWRYRQSCRYFRPSFVNWCHSNLFSDLPYPSPPLPKVKVQYTDSVRLWGGCRVLSCVVDHILQEFITLFLTRFRTYKIATPPQTKTPVKTTFFRDWCLYSSFVHVFTYRKQISEM